jgi:protein TonB
MSAIIASDGKIASLRVLTGHPLLVASAVDAVKRWVYSPTLLNGAPVEVITEITVTFTLN